MQKMTCSQRLIIIILTILTLAICGTVVVIFVLNSQEISQMFAPATGTLPPSPTIPTQTPTRG